MILVEAMFNDNLKRVVSRRREGKVENSSGFLIYNEVRRIIREVIKLKERRPSKRNAGIGITITKTMEITPAAIWRSLY